jgi:hypothetical protein
VKDARQWPLWPLLILAVIGLTALYLGPLRIGFLNDDYQFLEQARTQPLAETIGRVGAIGNYYRPLSRQLYFEALTPIAGGEPLVFHLANYLLFLGALALLADLLLALVPPAGAMVGCLYFALLPFQRVNLTWVSCAQDLLALVGSLAALALYRRGRTAWAFAAYLVAVMSKESALPLPLALAAWDVWIARRTIRAAAMRALPFGLSAITWSALAFSLGAYRHTNPALHPDPLHFLMGYVHMAQSLVGLEYPSGMLTSLFGSLPALVPLVMIAPLALAYERMAARPEASAPRARRDVVAFAALWLVVFGLMTGPVTDHWSAYYYTLAAVGAAIIIGLALARGDSWAWILLTSFLLWWHAGTSNARAFSTGDGPWGWTSHLTSMYLERGAELAAKLGRDLRDLEPAPPRDTRFFFATLPPWAGFQMGNGALVRALYHNPTLGSYFYSEFSESTAAQAPCRFVYWDGVSLRPLYQGAHDPFFQVGSDLLLLDRPAGAAHAFRRGLAAGENRLDHLYWLGWTELWLGHRDAAERSWSAFGARDDSASWYLHMRKARTALIENRDTLDARRELLQAIEYGIGRPDAHAVLGQLLSAERPKYAMLELKVATWLQPNNVEARRDLLVGLSAARLDDAARRELSTLMDLYPEWRSDSMVVRARRDLDRRSPGARSLVEF